MFKAFRTINETRTTPKSVYLCIHRNGPIAKNEILHTVGGSLGNLNRFLTQLEEHRMVSHTQGTGRRPSLYSIVPDAAFAFGGYINGNVVGLGLCDVAGNIIDDREAFFADLQTPERVVEFIAQAYQEIVTPDVTERCLGSAVAITGGPMNRKEGVMVSPPPTLPGWYNVPLRAMLDRVVHTPVNVELFAEAILVGEMLFGNHDIDQQIALLWLDEGIGASVANRGRMNLDQMDRTSILGHQVVDFNGIPCYCGKRGCLLTYGSIPALMRNTRSHATIDPAREMEARQRHRADPWHISADLEIVELTLNDEKYAHLSEYVFDDFDKSYSAGLTNVINVLRSNKVIFCGRLSEKYRDRLMRIVGTTEQNAIFYGGHEFEVEWKNLDRKDLIRGSAARVFNNYIKFVE